MASMADAVPTADDILKEHQKALKDDETRPMNTNKTNPEDPTAHLRPEFPEWAANENSTVGTGGGPTL